MEEFLEEIILTCQKAKVVLSSFFVLRKDYSVIDNEEVPVEERISKAVNLLNDFDNNLAKRDQFKTILCDLKLYMTKGAAMITEELKKSDNADIEYNFLLETMVDLQRQKMEQRKNYLEKQIQKVDLTFNKEQKILIGKMRVVPFSHNSLDYEEVKQIEEWTNMKVTNVIFDSRNNQWSVGESDFKDKVFGKEKLLFVVEDTNKNKFGGVIFSKISKAGQCICDKEAFSFTLKSNGRINGMQKFTILPKYSQFAFNCFDDAHHRLFHLCDASIYVFKKGESGSACYSNRTADTPDNVLCGSHHFTPERITVIQLK
ncbi:hypothetical protein EIN_021000 [Entamoeba invadens IP1]|uniref:hypothetical protein n=1 Tax=Entamoeba invadens IP1 TaxID=370355 RepID=UPI0002C3D8A7|nr:hypothetical protein EIN_021000 [Entamoeba invadens IP1]ELP90601.1 hypothetical protein EIN_021000 [Entamoeba invadens IP1]|eukprot:XP_004257372.1 hypothetical protein EIN_021000 [Entamoeba invadens IP1]